MKISPIYLDALRYDGKLWGLPIMAMLESRCIVEDWFEEKGITVPVNTDELMAAAEKLIKLIINSVLP